MRPIQYLRAETAAQAIAEARAGSRVPPTLAPVQFLAGGTTLIDLMKLDVMRPQEVVDINDLARRFGKVEVTSHGLRLGAFVRMAEAASDRRLQRDYPVIAQSLQLAASQQIRNMASLGGNVLQRTRCNYFRDTSWSACNKRNPGSGCAALGGVNRKHAILGTSASCIAAYPGDFAQALIALDTEVEIMSARGTRTIPFSELHVAPAATPQVETILAPDDLITAFTIRPYPWLRRSLYLKIRDRQSYEFALASAAVALDMDGEIANDVRIALGGVATKPWRAHEAEDELRGQPVNEQTASRAAHAAFATAVTHGENQYKRELGRRTLVRALLQAARMEV
jgi:xanthine dehydrogenase YagS FAD-binding subunit